MHKKQMAGWLILVVALTGCAAAGVDPGGPVPPTGPGAAKTGPAPVYPAPKFEDLARNADGSIKYFNQDGAIEYCAKQGSHLPNVREYIQLAISMGAKGIRETEYRDAPYNDPSVAKERELNGRDGYFVVYRENKAGKVVVDFYYNKNGYKRPAGELGTFWLWTSGQFPVDSGLAFPFDAPAGVIHYGFYHAKWYPVRCAAGPAIKYP